MERDHKAEEMRLVKRRYEAGICDSCGQQVG
jgi:hypothetical protein